MSRNLSPEAWKARVLADEIHDLTIIVRSLEFSLGFAEGVQAGRWQGVNEATTGHPVAVQADAARS